MPFKVTVLISIIVLITPIAVSGSGFGLSQVIDARPADQSHDLWCNDNLKYL